MSNRAAAFARIRYLTVLRFSSQAQRERRLKPEEQRSSDPD
jgi:hypothetical protein